MKALLMSPVAAALLRALLRRAGEDRDRFLLIDARSHDWQSLTFTGERHRLRFRITGPDADSVLDRFAEGLEEAEFTIGGQIVADVALAERAGAGDGSFAATIEALTLCA